MRIVCPSCSASYEVAAKLISGGRIVRCARCLREWSVKADDVDDSGPPARAARPPVPAPPPPVAPPPVVAAEPPHRDHIPDMPLSALEAEPARAAPAPRLVPLSPAEPPAAFGPGDSEPVDSLAEEAERAPPVTATAWTAWIASVALLALLAWAAYTWRADVVHLWPPSGRLYAALGLKVAPD